MKIELGKLDYGQGVLGLLVKSMVGDTGLKFTPEDEGVVGITTRIAPSSKKMLEQLAQAGGVSQSIITRLAIERGLSEIVELLKAVKAAKEEADAQDMLRYEEEAAAVDEDKEITDTVELLNELRKGGRK